MDAFSDNTQDIDTVVIMNTNTTTNDTINTDNISEVDSKKSFESNEILTIKSETETLPTEIDINIVKNVCKLYVAPVETCGETDRIKCDNEKLVQVINETNAENDTNIIELPSSLPCKDDQWLPLNANGKKVYAKEFLLALKNHPESRTKPENLLDVIAQEDRGRVGDINHYLMGSKPTDYTPKVFNYDERSLSNQGKGTFPKRNYQHGNSGGNSKGSSTSNVIASTLLPEDVKLNESANPWKPARFTTSIDLSDEDKKSQELYKKVRGVLNKLTPKKFEILLVQVRSLAIDTKERLQGVIDLVFEKAVDEPNFSVAYASMCSQLALMQVPSNVKKEGGEPTVNFRKLLITRCQLEFEKNSVDETARNGKLKEIEECTDPEKKKELQLLLEEEDRRIRRKSVGCIRFIGELFKQGMLTTNIMKKCLDQLLDNKEEESLECLCKLLSTVGKAIEDKDVDLNQTFVVIGEIIDGKHGKIGWRVRCMLYDVIDLRNSRRQTLNPKTLDQIQKEVYEEQNFQPQIDEPHGSSHMFGGWVRGSNIKTKNQQALEDIGSEVETRRLMNYGSRDSYRSKGTSLERNFNHTFEDGSVDQLERKMNNILEKYLKNCYTVDEYDEDIRTSLPPSVLPKLVSDSYICVLKRWKTAREGTGRLFANLIKRSTLSIDSYCTGLEEVLSQADDLTIDIPKIWDYLAEILAPIINEDAVPLIRLHKSFDIIIKGGNASKLLKPLFKIVITERGPNHLRSLWQNSGITIFDFMDSFQANNFIQVNKLEFLLGDFNTVVNQSELTYEQIHIKLLDLLKNENSPDDIFRWIHMNVGKWARERQFVRTLATAVFENSIVKSKLKIENLKKYYSLLKRIINGQLEYELECLYALQALINKLEHPQGILLSMCNSLYSRGVISPVSFVKWKTSDNVVEQEGKCAALKQLTNFFTYLSRADPS